MCQITCWWAFRMMTVFSTINYKIHLQVSFHLQFSVPCILGPISYALWVTIILVTFSFISTIMVFKWGLRDRILESKGLTLLISFTIFKNFDTYCEITPQKFYCDSTSNGRPFDPTEIWALGTSPALHWSGHVSHNAIVGAIWDTRVCCWCACLCAHWAYTHVWETGSGSLQNKHSQSIPVTLGWLGIVTTWELEFLKYPLQSVLWQGLLSNTI